MPAEESIWRAYFAFSAAGVTKVEGLCSERLRHDGIATGGRIQAVPRRHCAAWTEPEPRLEFGHEGRIGHLGVIAGQDEIPDLIDLVALRENDRMDSGCARRLAQGVDVLGCDGLAVVDRARGLAPRNGRHQRIGTRCGTRELIALGAVFPDSDGARPATRRRSDDQVLHRAPQTDEEMVVDGVDRRRRAREVREDVDGIGPSDEAPRLSVVAVRRQRGATDEILDLGLCGQRLAQSIDVQRVGGRASHRETPSGRGRG
ncbi:MAG: hypothetical protein KKC79_20350, partial [Gammaproteobacteria bacterium]|nr:hypothetical protein [Gammaproteobacteria bacterium]